MSSLSFRALSSTVFSSSVVFWSETLGFDRESKRGPSSGTIILPSRLSSYSRSSSLSITWVNWRFVLIWFGFRERGITITSFSKDHLRTNWGMEASNLVAIFRRPWSDRTGFTGRPSLFHESPNVLWLKIKQKLLTKSHVTDCLRVRITPKSLAAKSRE